MYNQVKNMDASDRSKKNANFGKQSSGKCCKFYQKITEALNKFCQFVPSLKNIPEKKLQIS